MLIFCENLTLKLLNCSLDNGSVVMIISLVSFLVAKTLLQHNYYDDRNRPTS